MLDGIGCCINIGLCIPMPGMEFPLGLYESDKSLELALPIQVPKPKALNILLEPSTQITIEFIVEVKSKFSELEFSSSVRSRVCSSTLIIE